MIDIKLIRENPAFFQEMLKIRHSEVDISALLQLDEEWKKTTTTVEKLRANLNMLSRQRAVEEAQKVKVQLQTLDAELRELTQKRQDMLDLIPNMLAPDTPVGSDDKDNLEIFKWGKIPTFDFKPLEHDVLGKKLGILDIERGTKLSGSGFYYWHGDGALLQNAAFQYTQKLLVSRGFELFQTPIMTKKEALYGTGYLPFAQDEIYQIQNSDLAMIGTSEQSLIPYRMNEILDEGELPLLYTACTPCFRYEAGAAGRMTKGIFRVHQFQKQEQIILCSPKDSEYWNLFCQRNVEDIMQGLEIPYRVVLVCTGDMGAPGYKKYDTEGWFAAFGGYRETHSNSNLTDYQARRANIRVKGKNGKEFVHTISSTALTDRAIIAMIENNQTKEGFIKIPKALQPYMGGREEIRPVSKKEIPMPDVSDLANRVADFNYVRIADQSDEIKHFFDK